MKYFLKVWLTTLLISPLFICISLWINKSHHWLNDFEGIHIFIILAMIMGTIFSLPAITIFYLLGKELQKKNINNKTIRVILSIYAVISIFITFSLLDGAFITISNKNFVWPVSYSLIMIVSICYFNMNIDNTAKKPII